MPKQPFATERRLLLGTLELAKAATQPFRRRLLESLIRPTLIRALTKRDALETLERKLLQGDLRLAGPPRRAPRPQALSPKLLEILRDASDAMANVRTNFFDEGDGPYTDLLRSEQEIDTILDQNPTP